MATFSGYTLAEAGQIRYWSRVLQKAGVHLDEAVPGLSPSEHPCHGPALHVADEELAR